MAKRRRLIAVVVLAGASPAFGVSALAQTPAAATVQLQCPVQPTYPLPTAQAELKSLAARLEPFAVHVACKDDAFFHAWRGAVLLASGDPAAAIEPLERALLAQPDLPGAQIDLAIALFRTGERAAGQALMQQLLQRPDVPDTLKSALTQAQQSAGGTPSTGLQQRLRLSVLLGGDSNLNNAPAVSEITLTLPTGNETLALAPSALPQRGAALLSMAQWQGFIPQGRSLWVLQADARARKTEQGRTGYLQGDVNASWVQDQEAPRQWIARVGASWLQFGGQALLRSTRGALQYQWEPLFSAAAFGGCRPSVGAELDQRDFPQTHELDGTYRGAVVGLFCSTPGVAREPGSITNVQLRVGRDLPQDALRPGGQQQRHELRGYWDAPVASPLPGFLGPGRVTLSASWQRQQDETGFSPLLSSNAPRRTHRYALGAETAFTLGGGFFAVGQAEASNQRSNLPAFSGRQRSLYLGLRWEMM